MMMLTNDSGFLHPGLLLMGLMVTRPPWGAGTVSRALEFLKAMVMGLIARASHI